MCSALFIKVFWRDSRSVSLFGILLQLLAGAALIKSFFTRGGTLNSLGTISFGLSEVPGYAEDFREGNRFGGKGLLAVPLECSYVSPPSSTAGISAESSEKRLASGTRYLSGSPPLL